MSRSNNQLPCEPVSNAEFCKAQLICCRNERLANCDSPQILPDTGDVCICMRCLTICVCVCVGVCACVEPNRELNKRLTQPESGADYLMTGWLCARARARAACDVCPQMWVCGCLDGGIKHQPIIWISLWTAWLPEDGFKIEKKKLYFKAAV